MKIVQLPFHLRLFLSVGFTLSIFGIIHSATLQSVFGMKPNTQLLSEAPLTNSSIVLAETITQGENWQPNQQGDLNFELGWMSNEHDDTTAIALGDIDNDGDLDLAVANQNQPNRIYQNDGLGNFTLIWSSTEVDNTSGIVLGDVDGDGYLDMVVANLNQANRIYHNDGNNNFTLVWSSIELDEDSTVALGDMDNDGDLDLAIGGNTGRVYQNDGGDWTLIWSSPEGVPMFEMKWNDMNQDNYLDLVSTNNVSIDDYWALAIYLNDLSGNFFLESIIDVQYYQYFELGDMDADGDFDLISLGGTGFFDFPPIYRNDSGVFSPIASSGENASSAMWGDMDGDGDLDVLSAENATFGLPQIKVIQNNLGTFSDVWQTTSSPLTDLAWGDVNGDGQLDIIFASKGSFNGIYYANLDVVLVQTVSLDFEIIEGSFADIDNDGDLDLATPGSIYKNNGNAYVFMWALNSPDATSVAWADIDGDGDLDLATGNGVYVGVGNNVYVNNGDSTFSLVWTSAELDHTSTIAWGDMDGDGDLDLAVGNNGQNRIYKNNGDYTFSLVWTSAESDPTSSIAWGDMDGDGDLDLAVGNSRKPTRIYNNLNGNFLLDWSSSELDYTTDVAWGDIDADGDLDLAVGNHMKDNILAFNRVYKNNEGHFDLFWTSPQSAPTYKIAFADINNDGFLDLIESNNHITYRGVEVPYANKVYLYNQNTFSLGWSSVEEYANSAMAIADLDEDGDLDLIFMANANSPETSPSQIYTNMTQESKRNIAYTTEAVIKRLDIMNNSPYANRVIHEGVVEIPYTLYDEKNRTALQVQGFFSLNGGGNWKPAIAALGTITSNVPASPNGTPHIFFWDINSSDFFGSSDNVVFRLEVIGAFNEVNTFQRSHVTTAYSPQSFRARGTQVRVLNEGGNPVAGATVYRLPVGQANGGYALDEPNTRRFTTNAGGYLLGRGVLATGDGLVAFIPAPNPITFTDKIESYTTSAAPTPNGLALHSVDALGVQTLTVSEDNQLFLLNLVISLEWDASYDPDYVARLEQDVRRASEIFFDLTNGQLALGEVTIYQNREQWENADVVIYASNMQRPSANLGGLVTQPMSDTLATGETVPYAFWPGQIRMPATWNRYGNPSGTIGEDWPRVLAHELGHYALFLLDNYLGIDDNGFLIQTDCAGSAMTDAYRQEYSEFLASPANSAGYGWTGDCLQTMAAKTTGRSDWETIQTFYPLPNTRLNSTQTGPLSLPIAVTRVTTVPPANPANPLADPFIYLVDEQGQALTTERGTAAGYLFQTQGTSDPSDDVITALGSPVGNLLQARGLASGDRVCLYTNGATPRVGCLANANPFNTTLLVPPVANWQPQISVQPVNSTTLAITVTQVSGVGPLQVQIYPSYRPTSTVQAVTGNLTTISPGVYATSLQFPMTIFHGYARVWVAGSNPLKEAIVPFSITPGWDGNTFASWGGNFFLGWDGNTFASWGGNTFASWGGNSFASWGGNTFASWGAPVASADGQVILFNTDDILGGNAATVLQVLNSPPNLPPWLTVVGQAYRYDTNSATGDNFVIQFQYLARELSALPESELRVYYLDDSNPQADWQRLATTIDDFRNLASAKMIGKGVYALVATVELPRFYIGWNNFSYPIYETRTVADGLASVAGAYTSVYQYEAQNQRWRLYDASVTADYPAYASLVNDLEVLEFGRAYWLYATQVITPYLGVQPDAAVVNTWPNFPPATYFGPVTADVPLTVGTAVEAVINGQVCGQGVLHNLGGQLAYKVQVRADNGDGCGDFGRQLTIRVAGQAVGAVTNWDNGRAHYLPLAIPKLYLPLVQRLP